MRDDEPVDLTPAERQALAALGSEWSTPAGLRDAVIGSARAQGLFEHPARSARRPPWASIAAAAVVAFTAGAWVGTRWGEPAPTRSEDTTMAASAEPQNHYLLLLWEDQAYDVPVDAAAHAARAREYGDWMRALQKAGRFTGGDELASGGQALRRVGEQVEIQSISPNLERGVLGGYFRISASNDEDAAMIARECPHLLYGGIVEIRRSVQ